LQEDSASLLMKHLGQRYVQYINRTYRRSGTLWEGRFRSCLTQSEDYVLACYRYIELNPVRARMVNQPEDYCWSSYRVNALDKCDALIQPHEQYMRMAPTEKARQAAYRALFNAHLEPRMIDDIRRSTNGNFSLGGDRFKEQIEQALGRRAAPGVAGRPRAQGRRMTQISLIALQTDAEYRGLSLVCPLFKSCRCDALYDLRTFLDPYKFSALISLKFAANF
jgi:putative transposase